MALLETRGLSVNYGVVRAVDNVDLACDPGTILGLIGPNGAGKTTFIDAVTGFVPLSSGAVVFDGVDVTKQRPSERATLGMTRTFQSLELFEDLTVRDNLLAAAQPAHWYSLFVDLVVPHRGARRVEQRVVDALDLVGLASAADRMPSALSHGQRRLVSVARAFVARPQLVLLDEPAAGLDTDESEALGALLRKVADDGTALCLVDHDMGLVLEVSDRVAVLDFGSLIACDTPAAVRTNPAVLEAYLGTGSIDSGGSNSHDGHSDGEVGPSGGQR